MACRCCSAVSASEVDGPGAASEQLETAPGPPVDRRSREYAVWVQQALNRVLGLGLAVDGRIGPATRSATRAFQRRARLATDGIVGSHTEQALLAQSGLPLLPRAGHLAPAPAGIRRDSDAHGLTLYAPIRLGGEPPGVPLTGIFAPTGFRPDSAIDIAIYLHARLRRRTGTPPVRRDDPGRESLRSPARHANGAHGLRPAR